MTSHFQAFSPSYENMASRMSRIKHHSQNHHISYAKAISPPKPMSLLTLDTNIKTRYNHRASPTSFNLREDTANITNPGKFTGRVTKNGGLKKYNQRQIKEVMNYREPLHMKTEGNNHNPSREKSPILCSEDNTERRETGFDKWPVSSSPVVDEVKMND